MTNNNPSLQKKTAARVAAVQCLYRTAIVSDGVSPEQQVRSLKEQLSGNREEQKSLGLSIEPNYTLVETLLAGVGTHQADIDARLDASLSAGWTRLRMSPLLVAVLRCAIFELFFHKDTKAPIIISEYTHIARSFFGDADVNFVHGCLSAMAQNQ